MATLTQSELIDYVYSTSDSQASKADVGRIVKRTFDAVADSLASGDDVMIPSFGKFEVRDVAARVGRNPRTGERVDIPAHRAPRFKPSGTLKGAVR